ncbi:MAG: DNA mismatch repair endonuclease MutL [Rhodothermales bacterium]
MRDVSVESDSLIHVMPEALANKIAAGEVVQRPASALKELLENALDAGADDITVILKESGSALIQVVDNGCGMSRADAGVCFIRHATSKISSIEDLEHIRTLGFRGEALASIASVAQVELRTKRRSDSTGFCIRIDGGDLKAAEPCATHDGTSVSVRNLFYNVPARRNFLKTPATELRHLVETFQALALANPAVAFRLLHDDMELFRLPAERNGDFLDVLRGRISTLFSDDYRSRLAPVEEQTSYLTVRGFVGEPELNRKSRGEQFLFVNGRSIRNRSLEHAIFSAFQDLLPEGVYPFHAIFLTLEPSRVDVNVHPAKAEVKFDDDRGIYNFLKSIVRKGLGSSLAIPPIEPGNGHWSEAESARSFGGSWPEAESSRGFGGPWPFPGTSPRFSSSEEYPGDVSERLYSGTPEASGFGARPEFARDRHRSETAGVDDTLLWQLHDRYILTQIRSGLMIVDQNAAHERVLYERALQNMMSGLGLSQQLLFPQTVDFSPADFGMLKELFPDLRALGFDVEAFSGRSAVVRGVPADIESGDERTLLEDLLAQYKLNRERLKVGSRENLAKSLARRSAIRPGTRLAPKEMRSLIDQLFACEMPYACPQGRPTIIKIPIEELDKRFSK